MAIAQPQPQPQPQSRSSIKIGCLRRRRGAELEDAILRAAYDELSAVGYSAFTVEGVAARARTGKASIYRRWPTKGALVLDALSLTLPVEQDCASVAGVPVFADDVTTADALRIVARHIAAVLNSPAGDAIRAIKSAAVTDPELARTVDERFTAPRRAALVALLERGVARGEVRPDALNPCIIDLLPAILSYRVVMLGERVTDRDLADIVEDVLLPVLAT
jgi:AcrR family transcriptional regulator